MVRPQLSVFNYSVENKSNNSIDIHIDGYIVDSPTLEILQDYWGNETSTSYKSFRDNIPADVETINLFVNSGGGHVGDAMAIHDYLETLETNGVTVNRDGRGIVASAATYLVMGKNSRLSSNCLFMIHNVSGLAYGNINELENQVAAMRKFNDMIVNFYSNKTGLSATVIGNMMDKETWLTAEEAKNKGFVLNVGSKANITNSIKPEHWPYSNMAVLNTYNSFSQTNTQIMDVQKITDTINNGFNTLLEKLGLSNKKEESNVKDALNEFTTGITNAITEAGAPSIENLNKLISDAITNAFKEPSEAITNAIAGANKGFVTNESLTTQLTSFKETITNSVSEKLGGKTGGETRSEEKKAGTNNKYRNRNLED